MTILKLFSWKIHIHVWMGVDVLLLRYANLGVRFLVGNCDLSSSQRPPRAMVSFEIVSIQFSLSFINRYTNSNWTYVKGNISSVDRSYGFLHNIIHNIGMVLLVLIIVFVETSTLL